MIKQVKSRRGETLLETLCAIMVFTFASIILLSMITAANNINQRVRQAEERFDEQTEAVEKKTGTGKSGAVKVRIGSHEKSVDVMLYGGEDGSLYAYYTEVAP